MEKRRITRNDKSGFTLIELIVVVALIAIISVSSFLMLGSSNDSNSVKNALSSAEAILVAARKKSITQEGGFRWGVRFENTTTSMRMLMFSGTSFSSSTPSDIYPLRRNIVFTNPISSSTYDLFFAPITGFPLEKKVFTIATLKKSGVVGDLIINGIGAVTKRNDSGVSGYWHFDEGVGTTTFDASGRDNTGTLVGGPVWQANTGCKAGLCLFFDGIDDMARLGMTANDLDMKNDNRTYSLWFKVGEGSYTTIRTLYASGAGGGGLNADGTWAYISSLNSVYINFSDGDATRIGKTFSLDKSVFDSNWHLLVATYNRSGLLEVYVDGVKSSTPGLDISVQSGYVNDVYAQNIGCYGNSVSCSSIPFVGFIDEVKIYNRVLSASEISSMYNDLK